MTGERRNPLTGMPIAQTAYPTPQAFPSIPPELDTPSFHVNVQWLRRNIGGGWQWNRDKNRFEVFLPPAIAKAINKFLGHCIINEKPAHLKYEALDNGQTRLSLHPEELAALKAIEPQLAATTHVIHIVEGQHSRNKTITWGEDSLANQCRGLGR
jgi:hypothetical protein